VGEEVDEPDASHFSGVWMIFGKYREILFRTFLDPGSRFYRFDRSFQSKLPRHHFEKRISAELFHGANSHDHRLTDPGTFVPADFQSFVSKLPISVIKKVQS
jgi:hypothetical protein